MTSHPEPRLQNQDAVENLTWVKGRLTEAKCRNAVSVIAIAQSLVLLGQPDRIGPWLWALIEERASRKGQIHTETPPNNL
jgi:hypothetical protein